MQSVKDIVLIKSLTQYKNIGTQLQNCVTRSNDYNNNYIYKKKSW